MTSRALLLASSRELVEPLARELATASDVERVRDVRTMRAALGSGTWDLVLCEDAALGADRAHVHELVHDAVPGVPLVVLPTPRGDAAAGLARLAAGLARVTCARAAANLPRGEAVPNRSEVRGIASLAWDAATAPRHEMRALLDHIRLSAYIGARDELNRAHRTMLASPAAAAREIVDWVREQHEEGGTPSTSLLEALDPTPDVGVPYPRLLMAVGHAVLYAHRAASGPGLLEVRTYGEGQGAWIEASKDGASRSGDAPPPALDSGLTMACEIVLGAGGTVILDGAAQHGVSLRAWLPATDGGWHEGRRSAA